MAHSTEVQGFSKENKYHGITRLWFYKLLSTLRYTLFPLLEFLAHPFFHPSTEH